MKIALLFLVRKELNHPRIWQKLLENAQGLFNIYIHAKEPMEDPFFKDFQLAQTVPTTYLIHNRAWHVLLQEALKDKDNVKFIYLSESCMPLYPLKDLYHYLTTHPESFMRYSKPWWPNDSEREVTEIPPEHRYGNAEWIILNRYHANLIGADQDMIDLFEKHKCDHESYPSSFLSLKGCLEEVVYRATTYASYIKPSGPYPYHFTDDSVLEANYIINAKRGGCLFARKFTQEFPSEAFETIVHQRLMLSPASILSSTELPPQVDQKILCLQAQEELSQANSCILLSKILSDSFFKEGYEIGVGLGLHMQRLCETNFSTKIYGVDDFKRKIYQGISFNAEEEEWLFVYVRNQIEYLNLNAEIIRDSSLDVAKKVVDHSIDFVYFNQEHISGSMEENLTAWFPKLHEGGIIAGYQAEATYPHLMDSIKQFFSEKNLPVSQNILEPKFWWVHLP